jgi:branched-subunit amino acid transport protein
MLDGAWIGQLIAGIFYLVIGIQLARLASRTGERPERLLSNMFFFTSISYILYLIPLIVPIEALWTPFNFAGRVSYIPAPILVALFTRDVFRSESRVSAWIVTVTAILLVVGVGGSAMMGDLEGFALENPFFWLEWTGYTLPFAWAGLEAFGQYYPSLRRQRLGLCDRMTSNRLLLWGYFGLVQVGLSLVLLQMYADYGVTNVFSSFLDRILGALEMLALALIWLVFFPPRFYRKLISGTEICESSVEES